MSDQPPGAPASGKGTLQGTSSQKGSTRTNQLKQAQDKDMVLHSTEDLWDIITPGSKPPAKPDAKPPAKQPGKPTAVPPVVEQVDTTPPSSLNKRKRNSERIENNQRRKVVSNVDRQVLPGQKPSSTTSGQPKSTAESGPLVGGDAPIIITGPDGKGGIALLTHGAQTQAALDRDYLYQVLTKIRNNDIFSDLMARVVRGKTTSWAQMVADHQNLPPDQQLPREVLERLLLVPENVGIVVIDRAGFAGLEVDLVQNPELPQAGYTPSLHTIEIDSNAEDDPYIAGVDAGGYWLYFKRMLFELCNAGQRETLIRIDDEVKKGAVDCVVYTLAHEVVESMTEEIRDDHWAQVLNSKDCRTIIDEKTGRTKVLNPKPTKSDLFTTPIAPNREKKLQDSLTTSHPALYIDAWQRLSPNHDAMIKPDFSRTNGRLSAIRKGVIQLTTYPVGTGLVEDFLSYVNEKWDAALNRTQTPNLVTPVSEKKSQPTSNVKPKQQTKKSTQQKPTQQNKGSGTGRTGGPRKKV
ncbi:hypothetical protein [Nonomuraea jiangxiensis]|uniref:Uncharacterized protein n=1 Tax=Nonomuraea jiangxiensis TaxID=633440 RepID=A0A1G9VYB7_9ACTN|nr:hypothetical protein [Nonomuraea jiangxiensis]SDM77288.1 hypothetical protein SAMN05421869_15519 [Nonomuraea jiangxiensis]